MNDRAIAARQDAAVGGVAGGEHFPFPDSSVCSFSMQARCPRYGIGLGCLRKRKAEDQEDGDEAVHRCGCLRGKF
jgi:hypothetical protein